MKKLIFTMFIGLLTSTLHVQPVLAAEEFWEKHPGKWVKEATFLQANIGCLQVWQCTHKEDVLHGEDTKLRTTPPAKTTGVCNAGGGAADSCNICAASEPEKPCKWWLEKK